MEPGVVLCDPYGSLLTWDVICSGVGHVPKPNRRECSPGC